MPRLFFLAAFLLFAGSAHAFTSRVVFASGDAAPFAGSGATWSTLETAYVDAEGTLTIEGTVVTPGNLQESRVCVAARNGNDFTLVAQPGMLAPVPQPAEGAPIAVASYFAYGALQGRTLLVATLGGSGVSTTNDDALLLATPEGLELIAREGDFIPGTTQPIVMFRGGPRLDPAGGVTFAVSGASSSEWYTFRREPGGAPQLLGTSTTPGTMLGSQAGYALISAHFPNGEGGIVNSTRRLTANGSTTIAQAGSPAPEFAQGWLFTSVTGNSCNDAGQVLFTGTARNLALPPAEDTRHGLWLSDGETAKLVARVGDVSPVAGVTFGFFRHPVINGAGDIAFFSGDSLFLMRQGRPLERIAYSGMAAPRHSPHWNFGTLTRDGLHFSHNGNLVFVTDTALWVFNSDNQLHRLATTAALLQRNGAFYNFTKLQTFASAAGGQDGRRRSVSDRGHIAFVAELQHATSSAKISAIILATLPHQGDPGHSPTARPDLINLPSGARAPFEIPVLANDTHPDGGVLTLHQVEPSWAGFPAIENGVVRYFPSERFFFEDRFTYTIRDEHGNFSTAEVIVRNPRATLQGRYTTVLRQWNSPAGVLSISVGARGQVSGRMTLDGTRYSFRGTLGLDGSFIQRITRSGQSIVVAFNVRRDEFENSILSGNVQANFGAYYTVDETTAFGLPPQVRSQRVTMQLRTSPKSPQSPLESIGFATGALSASGNLRLAGRLLDNRPFTTGVTLKRDGTFTIATDLLRGTHSMLTGNFAIQSTGAYNPVAYQHWAGELRWTYYHGFGLDMILDAGVSTFETFPGMPSLLVHGLFDDAAVFEAAFDGYRWLEQATVRYADLVTFPAPNSGPVQLKVNRATGLVTGSFAYDGYNESDRASFRGVIFPPRNEAAGIVPHPVNPGYFQLTPKESF